MTVAYHHQDNDHHLLEHKDGNYLYGTSFFLLISEVDRTFPQVSNLNNVIFSVAGLFTGSFIALFSVYAILAHLAGIFSATEPYYIETVYPVFR